MRFHLLETLREYGSEQLAADERAALARQHAHFFLALAETAEPELTQADQVLWLDRLEREHDNLRAALAWSLEAVDSGQWSVVSEVKDSESELPTAHGPLSTASTDQSMAARMLSCSASNSSSHVCWSSPALAPAAASVHDHKEDDDYLRRLEQASL